LPGGLHTLNPVAVNKDVMVAQDEGALVDGDVQDVAITDEQVRHGVVPYGSCWKMEWAVVAPLLEGFIPRRRVWQSPRRRVWQSRA